MAICQACAAGLAEHTLFGPEDSTSIQLCSNCFYSRAIFATSNRAELERIQEERRQSRLELWRSADTFYLLRRPRDS